MILCEKPLAMNGPEGLKMVEAVEKAKVPNMVWYNYRRVPAVTLAKQLIDEGKLGKIFHYRAKFLQDWTISADLPQGGAGLWRLDVAAAGSGVTGDLLAHCIDTALWLNGGINDVCAMTETFVKERKHNLTGKVEKVGIDDACAFLCRFKNGSLATSNRPATPAATRRSTPSRSTAKTRRSPGTCTTCIGCNISTTSDESKIRGWQSDPRHRQRSSLHGQMVGARPADRLRSQLRPPGRRLPQRRRASGKPAQPDFRNAYETQLVLDAVLDSAKERSWREVR